jgi:hypothetical protein
MPVIVTHDMCFCVFYYIQKVGGRNIFSMAKYDLIQEQIWDIPLGVYCLEDGIREKGEIQEIMGIVLTQLEYNKLRGSIKYIRAKYKATWDMRGKGRSITEWLAPIKKGSKKLRNLMSGRRSRQYRNFTFERIKTNSHALGKNGNNTK